MRQLAFDFSVALAPTLDNFVAGRNAELVVRLRGLAEARFDERFIYMWGAASSGRTHLLRASLALLASAGARTAFIACDGDTTFERDQRALDAIGVDDVERLSHDGQIALFNLYNALRESGRTLLVTGNVAPMQLRLRPEVVTRLGWGLVYEVHGLTDAEKAEALAAHAAARGFALQADLAQYLLTRVRRDIPTLLAILDELDRYSMESKRPVTVPLLRELLAPQETAK